jgi:hypothetical protein
MTNSQKTNPKSESKRKTWKKKTPIEVVQEQAEKLRAEVAKAEAELAEKRKQLEKFEKAIEVFETD